MLSLLGKLQQNTRDLTPGELMQLGHDHGSISTQLLLVGRGVTAPVAVPSNSVVSTLHMDMV